jgi:hypothetical protein
MSPGSCPDFAQIAESARSLELEPLIKNRPRTSGYAALTACLQAEVVRIPRSADCVHGQYGNDGGHGGSRGGTGEREAGGPQVAEGGAEADPGGLGEDPGR